MRPLLLVPLLLAACKKPDPDPTPTAPGTPPRSSDAPDPTATGGTSTGTTIPDSDYCPAWPASGASVTHAAPGDDLQAKLDGLTTGGTLELADGTYTIDAPLVLSVPGVTVRSESGVRDAVVLDAELISDAILVVRASDVAIVSVTLANAYSDGIQVVPAGADITGTNIYDVAVVDALQFGVSITADPAGFHADGGTIACSHTSLSSAVRFMVRNSCRTGGIEAVAASGWTVRDTEANGYWCTLGLATGGVRFWQGSRDTAVDRVVVGNSRRGVVLGFGTDMASVRTYPDDPCGGAPAQHYGGHVANAMIYVNDGFVLASSGKAEDGVALESACEAKVLHNTTYLGDVDPIGGAIVHRYAGTTGTVANNLTVHAVRRLDGSLADASSNVEGVSPTTTFLDPANGDLHLAATAVEPIGAGDPQWLTDVPEDLDGQARTANPDCGADERL